MPAATGDPEPAWLKDEATQTLLHKSPHKGRDPDNDHDHVKEPDVRDDREDPFADVEQGGGRDKAARTTPSSKRQRSTPQGGAHKRKRITKPFFAVLCTLTALIHVAVICANLYVLVSVLSPDDTAAQGRDELKAEGADRAILRGYALVLSLVGILTELNVKWWTRRAAPILRNHLARGVTYSMVGFMTMTAFDRWDRATNVVGLLLLCVSGVYVASALVCMRRHVEVD